jgi:hypothetical protein
MRVIGTEADVTCEHGTAMDVHCCNCHSGFLFAINDCHCTFACPSQENRPMEERMLKWFVYAHLPEDLQKVSSIFAAAAHATCEGLKAGPERTVALRKLLEAKDAAVRQAIEDRG